MSRLQTEYPIYTIDNHLLLPAGTELTEAVMDELSAGRPDQQSRQILAHDTVKRDLQNFLTSRPYSYIFADPNRTAEILKMIEEVRLIPQVLRSLDYFKKNDFHTYRHVLMVFVLTATLAKELQSGHFRRIQESMTGPTHDFGKICIPLSILKKSTALTRKELQIIRHHTVAGYVLLAHYLGDRNHIAARVALNHHECLDGSGYPRGIRELDPIVEIKAVADVYDALISPRPYRPVSFDNRSALEVLTQMAEKGTVSRNVVKALIAHNRKDKPHYQEVIISSEKRGIPPANNMYGIITDEEGN